MIDRRPEDHLQECFMFIRLRVLLRSAVFHFCKPIRISSTCSDNHFKYKSAFVLHLSCLWLQLLNHFISNEWMKNEWMIIRVLDPELLWFRLDVLVFWFVSSQTVWTRLNSTWSPTRLLWSRTEGLFLLKALKPLNTLKTRPSHLWQVTRSRRASWLKAAVLHRSWKLIIDKTFRRSIKHEEEHTRKEKMQMCWTSPAADVWHQELVECGCRGRCISTPL